MYWAWRLQWVSKPVLDGNVLRNSAKYYDVDVVCAKHFQRKVYICSEVFCIAPHSKFSTGFIHGSSSVHSNFHHQLNNETIPTWTELYRRENFLYKYLNLRTVNIFQASLQQTAISTESFLVKRTIKCCTDVITYRSIKAVFNLFDYIWYLIGWTCWKVLPHWRQHAQ